MPLVRASRLASQALHPKLVASSAHERTQRQRAFGKAGGPVDFVDFCGSSGGVATGLSVSEWISCFDTI